MHLETVWKALTWVWLAGEIFIAIFTRSSGKKADVQDRGTQILIWVVIVASLWMQGWMHGFLPSDMPGRSTWLRPVAVGCFVLGLAIRTIAILTLGKSFSANVATHAAQTLQRSGLYSLVRHPSYLGLELILFAAGLHTRTWACFAVAFIPPTIAVLYRIHVEEIALRRAFGAEYDDYSRTTKRLIPGLY
jgi:protein-S-isoprenylcysteine O-methyltransferase